MVNRMTNPEAMDYTNLMMEWQRQDVMIMGPMDFCAYLDVKGSETIRKRYLRITNDWLLKYPVKARLPADSGGFQEDIEIAQNSPWGTWEKFKQAIAKVYSYRENI